MLTRETTPHCSVSILLVLTLLSLFAIGAGVSGAPEDHSLAKLASVWDDIVPVGAKVEKLRGRFQWVEGPVWDRAGYLLFSDIATNQIYQWTPDGRVMTFRKPSGISNGLTLDHERRLIACEQGNRRVSRTEKDGRIVTLVDRYHGKLLNSPNDVVVRSDGSVYFTDPSFGLADAAEQELPYQGVYRLASDGRLTLLADDFVRPNGLAFSPDEKTLYVDDSDRGHVRAFDVAADGTLGNGRLFARLKAGGGDGMKVDIEGNIYVAASGVEVFDRAGRALGAIKVPEGPANVSWGDDDGKTLYITASTGLYRIRLNIAGIRP